MVPGKKNCIFVSGFAHCFSLSQLKGGILVANELPSMARQIAALQRIAAFSARVRGHDLGEWQTGEEFASASCIRCRAEVRVYYSPIQPEMDGAALNRQCGQGAAEQAA
jgi:hypothetical protein